MNLASATPPHQIQVTVAHVVAGALHAAGTTVLPGGAGERHVVAGPFLPSRLPG